MTPVTRSLPRLLVRADELLRPGLERIAFPPRTLLAPIVLFGLVYGFSKAETDLAKARKDVADIHAANAAKVHAA